MKRRREGTLEDIQPDEASYAKDLEKIARNSVCGPADFIRRADELIDMLARAPRSLRAKRAEELQAHVAALRRVPAGELGQVYSGICAGLLYGELVAELRADVPSKQAGLTRTAYFQHKAKARSQKELASLCGMSRQALLRWEKDNL